MILIVDDKPENIYSLKRLLETKNFDVDTALSGEEALKKILKNNYALIILDVQMPVMDGFEVAETLSGFSKTKDIPIIFLSAANTDKKFITRGYASGAIDYVTKPVDPEILMLKVKTFYKLYEQTLALNETQTALRAEIEIRKKVQAELKQRVDQLHFTLESLPQLAFAANTVGKIEFVNKQWFKYSESPDQFPPTHSDNHCIEEKWKKCREKNIPLEMEVQLKELGSDIYRFHLLRIIPIKENENTIKWVGTFTDIEDQKQAEKKKDEFLSIASHELKTPLTSIKAYVQLLERSISRDDDSVARTYISRAETQLTKLNNLIADLLDISKIESGKLKLHKKYFNFEKLLSSVIDIIYQTHEQVEIVREGTPIQQEVLADEIRIEQVLINYLTNALKYSPQSEKVIINTEKLDNTLKVTVTDFGIGIPESKQNNIFSKFFRVEESSLRFQGLGIGLYICSEIIRQHDGTFGVTSAEGEGSSFFFTIPLN